MMKSTQAAAKLQLIGAAKSISSGKGSKSSPMNDLRSAWRKGGFRAALPILAAVFALYVIGGGLILALIVAVGLALTFVRAYVMTYLWAWFVVPLGVPSLGMAHAIGLALLFGFMMRIMFHDIADRDGLKRLEKRILAAFGKEPEADKNEWKRVVGRLFVHFSSPLVALGMGYIVHSYM